MVNERVFQGLAEESHVIGTFGHGFTYSGHPVPAAVAIETLKIYDEMNMIDHVRQVGAYMQAETAPALRGPRTGRRGPWHGPDRRCELVADKPREAQLRPGAEGGMRLTKLCEANGVIARTLPNDTMAFSPPLIINEAEIDEMLAGMQHGA